MIHQRIGDIGHLFVIIAFVTSLITAGSYFLATTKKDQLSSKGWAENGRITFFIHALAVAGLMVTLFLILYNHYYEYHYAWSHSSRHLPSYYMVSAFWEGQEGSFMLWIFWQSILGLILIFTNRKWEAPVMTIFALVQAFLVSMIMGVVIFHVKIGSSPFLLLRDVLNDPVFSVNPDFVPEDGSGLNPLLQNYWMVIHPPTLFLGFALTLVPFAFVIAGLWKRDYKTWIRPALPWSILGAAILGLGIVMGAIWAYETLNFGGYWNWDPVENAVYVPWLFLVASIHTMITFKNSDTALKTAIILVIVMFVLILYSTFLTRSGILGDSSVHSFTDLGLSGQLLLYLLFFLGVSLVLIVTRWKEIPSSEKEVSSYSREFWIFIGVTILCLMGFQVLIPTSIPVFNAVVESFGGTSSMAPPADQVSFYSKFQVWFAILLLLLSGTGQFFWWKKMDKEALKKEILIPAVLALLVSTILIPFSGVSNPIFLVLLTAGIYSVIANGRILFSIKNSIIKLSGGSVAHIGIALMLIGIMFSSGYSHIISRNRSGTVIHPDLPTEINTENVLLMLNEPKQIEGYKVRYKGQRFEINGFPGYVSRSDLEATNDPYLVIANKDINLNGKNYFEQGDTLEIAPENTYYEVEYTTDNGRNFSLFPRAQINEDMGGILASPDIHRGLGKDLYTHVSSIPDPQSEKNWSETEELTVEMDETFFVNDYVAKLVNVERVFEVDGVELGENDVAVEATIEVLGEDQAFEAHPLFVIKDNMMGQIPDFIDDLGVKLSLINIHPEDNNFTIGVNTSQKDYIIMKAMIKPMINLLWAGTILMLAGFGIAMYRRYNEFLKMRNKQME